MEPDTGREHAVDERRRLVQPPAGQPRQPDRQAAYRLGVADADVAADQPCPDVDPHRTVPVDRDIAQSG